MPNYANASGGGRFGDVASFLIPATICIEFLFIGRIFLSEIIAIAVLIITALQRGNASPPRAVRQIVLLLLLGLFSQIVTDFVRDTEFADWSRGWAKIVFILISFLCFANLLVANQKRMIFAAYGIAVGYTLQNFITPNIYAEFYPWKFGFGSSATILIILYANHLYSKNKWIEAELVAVFAAALNLAMDFRSLSLLCGAVALLSWVSRVSRSANSGRDHIVHLQKVLFWLAFASSIAYLGILVYSQAASSGLLGQDALEKYFAQSGGDYGTLVGARLDAFGAVIAISDSPIIGYGSWAKDPDYVRYIVDRFQQAGYIEAATLRNYVDSEQIPSHSYLLGAWVEAGVLGSLVWFFSLMIVAKALIALVRARFVYLPLAVYFLAGQFVNILFSPMGAEQRMLSGLCMGVAICALEFCNRQLGRSIEFRW